MADTLRAMAISGGILLSVVVLIIIVSMVAVKRGEIAMHDDNSHRGGHPRH